MIFIINFFYWDTPDFTGFKTAGENIRFVVIQQPVSYKNLSCICATINIVNFFHDINDIKLIKKFDKQIKIATFIELWLRLGLGCRFGLW
jgi:hypothetical protein